MRIVGGRHKSRAVATPKGRDVRPTSDRTREAVFNILEHAIDGFTVSGTSVVDLFAGTGALGLEALSRGARHATFIDRDANSLGIARRNAVAVGETGTTAFLRLDACRLPPPARIADAPCGLAFLDPPYEKGFMPPALLGLMTKGWLAEGAVLVLEMAAGEPLDLPSGFRILDERIYGAARVVFLRFFR